MKIVDARNKQQYQTFMDLQIGELFSFANPNTRVLGEGIFLKIEADCAVDLTRDLIGNANEEFEYTAPVKRVKGHLVVEEVED